MTLSDCAALPAMTFLLNGGHTSGPLRAPLAVLAETDGAPTQAQAGTVHSPPPMEGPPVKPAAPGSGNLKDLKTRVAAAQLFQPIDNWEFAERVWVGLRPHLRTRLWVLDALLARGTVPVPGAVEEAIRLDKLAVEIHHLETEMDEVLRHRTSLADFSTLLERRVAPCLGQMESLQQALHEHHGV
jgi:hypothetical protein